MTRAPPAPFILGTVQLGLDYGLANRAGQPEGDAAWGLLDAASAAGVATFDTAHAYGSSEVVIGEWLRARQATTSVITKVPPVRGAGLACAVDTFGESLQRLGLTSVAGLLLHRSVDWATDGLPAWAGQLRESGRIAGFGVSVYDPVEIPDDPRIDMVQLPLNAFSPQIVQSTAIDRLRNRGARIYVRSVFAQGLLLLPASEVTDGAAALKPHLAHFHAIAAEDRTSAAALAIAAVRHLLPEAQLVLGAETADQVTQLAAAATMEVSASAVDEVLKLGRAIEPGLFDPRRWTRQTEARR